MAQSLYQKQQQKLQQKLSPRHIQLMKLLQVPSVDLEMRIKDEIEANPALELSQEREYNENNEEAINDDSSDVLEEDSNDDITEIEEYNEIEFDNPFEASNTYNPDNEDISYEVPAKANTTLHDTLMNQLGLLDLDETKQQVAKHIIGSIDNDGYLRRTVYELSDDLAFKENIFIDEKVISEIISKIKEFEPAGVAAADLQECLSIQLSRIEKPDETTIIAQKIINNHFEAFSKKHFTKIKDQLEISDELLKSSIDFILKLSPKPGNNFDTESNSIVKNVIVPDFYVFQENEKLIVTLNEKNAPQVTISLDFMEMTKHYEQQNKLSETEKKTFSFLKQNIDNAKWFIYALKQRQNTLLSTMNAIVKYQKNFFLTGDVQQLNPLILKDISEEINMDISTISRVTKSKYVQTIFGIYPLKYFFSDSYANEEGEEIATTIIKHKLANLVNEEDKTNPMSDKQLTDIINKDGYNFARRTISKYREQLQIPVARLRKELN